MRITKHCSSKCEANGAVIGEDIKGMSIHLAIELVIIYSDTSLRLLYCNICKEMIRLTIHEQGEEA